MHGCSIGDEDELSKFHNMKKTHKFLPIGENGNSQQCEILMYPVYFRHVTSILT